MNSKLIVLFFFISSISETTQLSNNAEIKNRTDVSTKRLKIRSKSNLSDDISVAKSVQKKTRRKISSPKKVNLSENLLHLPGTLFTNIIPELLIPGVKC
jgi:hypothetical protein